MTTPVEIERIAEGLSAGERRALLDHIPGEYRGKPDSGWGVDPRCPESWGQAGRSLMDRRLIAWHPNQRDSRTHLTRMGIAVRAHIGSQTHD